MIEGDMPDGLSLYQGAVVKLNLTTQRWAKVFFTLKNGGLLQVHDCDHAPEPLGKGFITYLECIKLNLHA